MTAATPAPLVVRPPTGVLMHSLIQSNPAVPATYEADDLSEEFCHTLQACREMEEAVTVAELAARTGHSPAVAGVIVTELVTLDLVHVVRAPAWAERLRMWAAHSRPVPVASSVVKMLVVSTQDEHTHHALTNLAETGPWRLQKTPRIDIATARLAHDLQMLTLGFSALGSTSPIWADVCRAAFGAVVITGPEPQDLTTIHENLKVLWQAEVPVVVLVHHGEVEGDVDIDVVRASLRLPVYTPVVVGEARKRGVCDAVMALCTSLMNEGRS